VELEDIKEVSALRVRIKFTKTGCVQYVGHLDIMRYFQKALRRADFDVAFSEGFSPHMIMSFAAPLGVGVTSQGEYFDVELRTVSSSADMVKALNETMVEGVEIKSIRQVPDTKKDKAMTMVGGADYLVTLKDAIIIKDWADKFAAFMEQKEIVVIKKTKKSETSLDIRPLIHRWKVENENALYLRLCCGSENNLKPNLVLEAFYAFLQTELPAFSYHVERIDTYTKDFISLGELGETIE
jgi:radical SAM-linked protein